MNCPECDSVIERPDLPCDKCGYELTKRDILDFRKRRGGPFAAKSGVKWQTDGRPSSAARLSELDSHDEEELWHGSFSIKAMMGYWLVSLFASIVLPIVGQQIGLDRIGWQVLIGLLAIMWVGLFAYFVYNKINVHYRLTNHQFIHKVGILRRRTNRIEVIDIDDVSYEQTIVDRLFGVGTIELSSSDTSHPDFILDGVDDVREIAALIDQARRAERLRRGVHIESI